MFRTSRHHDISAAHRLYKHKGACRFLHGHNYRIHFTLASECTNELGMVVDFKDIKKELCQWLDKHWDHKTILNVEDPLYSLFDGDALDKMDETTTLNQVDALRDLECSVVGFIGNPTAENMAKYLLEVHGPRVQMAHPGVKLVAVTVEENAKSKATYEV